MDFSAAGSFDSEHRRHNEFAGKLDTLCFEFSLSDPRPYSTFQILILSSVVAVSMAYPYPMPVPVAIAYPQSVPSYVAPPKFEERADVGLDRSGHHGYDEHLGRVKMQVCISWSSTDITKILRKVQSRTDMQRSAKSGSQVW